MTSLDTADKIAKLVSSVATVLAIAAGAFWFFWRRQSHIAALVSQDVHQHEVKPGTRYVRASVKFSNIGHVAAYPVWTSASVSRIAPVADVPKPSPDGEVEWPVMASAELRHGGESFVIDAGESDVWPIEFVVNGPVEIFQVHTMVYVARTKAGADESPTWQSEGDETAVQAYLDEFQYWDTVTLVDLRPKPPQAQP